MEDFYHQNTILDAFRTNSRNIIGRNASMVIALLANQDLTPMLIRITPKGAKACEVLMGPFRGFQEIRFLHNLERKLR